MLTRRDVLKTTAVGTPLLLAASSVSARSDSGDITPSPPTPKWAKPLRIPNQPTDLNVLVGEHGAEST